MAELRKNQEIWTGLYEQLNKTLKQAGDLNHYASYVSVEVGELLGEESLKEFLEQSEMEDIRLLQKTSSKEN